MSGQLKDPTSSMKSPYLHGSFSRAGLWGGVRKTIIGVPGEAEKKVKAAAPVGIMPDM